MNATDILYRNAVCGYVSCTVDGTITRVNQTLNDWLGYADDDLVGRRFQSLLSRGAGIFYETQIAPALAIHGIIREVAFDLIRQDGTLLPVLVSAKRQASDDDSPAINWVSIFNATDRRRYEDDLLDARRASDTIAQDLKVLNETLEQRVADEVMERLKAEDALRQSQKIEAIGQLTGGLAHDFNNLLTGIAGNLELIQLRMRQGRLHDLERYVSSAQGAAQRAAALTHRLLAFSRRQTLDPKPVNVDDLVVGLEGLLRSTVGAFVTIDIVREHALWTALVDGNQLENALLNLCINARDAMPDGGGITIEMSNASFDPVAARAQDVPPGEFIAICVTDTGTGMPAQVVARAFDPFFTTKPLGQGTGLGLSMVHGFTRQSGGQVKIDSEVGRGTTIRLYLPRHDRAADPQANEPELTDAARAGPGQTVLIVDDEPTVLNLITEVLEDLGYEAIVESHSADALKILQSRTPIDLMVTDVGLPGAMNGRQLADAGRALRPSLSVLFITGYAENAIAQNGQLDGRMQVLTKPFHIEALATKIKAMIQAR